MFILIRALTYAAFFIGFLLVALPALGGRPGGTRASQPSWAGLRCSARSAGHRGALVDVVVHPHVRRDRPRHAGAVRSAAAAGRPRAISPSFAIRCTSARSLAMLGAAAFYQSPAIAGYAAAFFLVMHLFVIAYEEPTLRDTFGPAYDDYCARVGRWTLESRMRLRRLIAGVSDPRFDRDDEPMPAWRGRSTVAVSLAFMPPPVIACLMIAAMPPAVDGSGRGADARDRAHRAAAARGSAAAIERAIPPEELSGYDISGLPFNLRQDRCAPRLAVSLSHRRPLVHRAHGHATCEPRRRTSESARPCAGGEAAGARRSIAAAGRRRGVGAPRSMEAVQPDPRAA